MVVHRKRYRAGRSAGVWGLLAAGLAVACLMATGLAAAEKSAAADLVALAPEGSWGVLVLDVPRIMALSPVQTMKQQGAELPPELDKIEAAAFFLLPMEPPLDDYDAPLWCGIVKLAPGGADLIKGRFADMVEFEVDGVTAYEGGDAMFALVDDSTLVLGGDEDALTSAIRACRRGDATDAEPELLQGLDPSAADAVYGSVMLPASVEELLGAVDLEDAPQWALGIKGGALAVAMGEVFKIRGVVWLASADDAEQMVREAQEGIEKAKAELNEQIRAEPMLALVMQPLFAILDKLQFSAEGAEFRAGIELSQGEFTSVWGIVAMPLMFMRGHAEFEPDVGATGDKANLHNIGLGIAMWCVDHDDEYPPNLEVLVQHGYLDGEGVFLDPGDWEPVERGEQGYAYSYDYAGPIPIDAPSGLIMCCTRKGVYEEGRHVLYVDQVVDWVTEEELHRPAGARGMSLAECYQWMVDNWEGELSDDDDARLRKFYEIED